MGYQRLVALPLSTLYNIPQVFSGHELKETVSLTPPRKVSTWECASFYSPDFTESYGVRYWASLSPLVLGYVAWLFQLDSWFDFC